MNSSTEAPTLNEFAKGWPVLLTCILGVAFACNVMFFYTFGVFMRPLETEFGWSRTQLATGTSLASLTLALSGLAAGVLVDKFGARPVIVTSILAGSIAFAALSWTADNLPLFWANCSILALVGGGTTLIPYVRLIVTWFERAQGLAIGLTMVGTGITASIAPTVVSAIVERFGWQAGYQAVALAALLPLPLVLLFARERRVSASTTTTTAPALTGVTLVEAAREPRFWIMAFTFMIAACAIAGLVPHLIPMLQESGLSPAEAAGVFGGLGIAMIVGRIVTGFLLDRFFAPLVTAIVFAIAAAAWISLYVFGASFAALALILVGLTVGAEADITGYMTARYFGRRHYGAIFGFLFGVFTIGGAISPIVAAMIYQQSGDQYGPVLLAAALALLITAPLMLWVGPYPDWCRPSADSLANTPPPATSAKIQPAESA